MTARVMASAMAVGRECRLLVQPVTLVDLGGISGVEGNPQEDELTVPVGQTGLLLSALQPAERPMHAQREIGRMRMSLSALAGFEVLVVHEGG
jgi:hypothetical protein